jgi:hypothetical protein
MSCIQNYTLTEYPKLYSHTYWGTGGRAHEEDLIIENRNRFATEYNLKSGLSKIAQKYREKAGVFKDLNEIKNFKRCNDGDKCSFLHQKDKRQEHIEYYKTNDKKIIAVFSPYDISESMTKMALECGYSLIYPIYSTMANTFVKEIITNKA